MPRIRYAIAAAVLASALWAQSPAPPGANSGVPAPPVSQSQSPDASPPPASNPSPAPTAPPGAPPPPDSTTLVVNKLVKPAYPPAAVPEKLQGQVIVRMVVSETGDVETAEVISGNPVLANAAVDAVKQWKFKPYIRNGQPVKAAVKLPFDFAPPAAAVADATPKPADTNAPPAKTDTPAADSTNAPDLTLDRIEEVKGVLPSGADQGKPPTDMIVKIHISEVGDVEGAELVSGNPALAGAALDAAKQWKFKPFLRSGKPVKVSTVLPVVFAPSERGPAGSSVKIKVGVFRESDTKSEEPKNDPVPALGDPSKRIHVSQQIMNRMVLQMGTLSYPSAAKQAKIQGTVVLKAIISKEGAVEDLQPVSGPEQLLDGSMKSVRQRKYRPFMLDDQPVEVETTVTLNFKMSG